MYDFEFHSKAEVELGKLNKSIQILFSKKLKKILTTPEIGKNLGNKNNLTLVGLKKTYFNNKKYRIVYQVVESKVLIYIVAVAKRENMKVYKLADARFNAKNKKI